MQASTKLSVMQFAQAIVALYVTAALLLTSLVLLSGGKVAVTLLVNALLAIGGFAVGVAVHEAAHAFTALLVGLDVTGVRIGLGPVVWRGSLRGADIEVRSVPFSGATVAVPKSVSWVRWRYWLYVAAGPAANASVMFGAIRLGGWSTLLVYDTVNIAGVLFASNAILVFAALLPTGRGLFGSDGEKLAMIPFTRGIGKLMEAAHFACKAQLASQAKDLRCARAWVERGLSKFPSDVSLRSMRGLVLLEEGEAHGARNEFFDLLADPALPAMMREIVENNAAWASLFTEEPAHHEEALRLARRVWDVRSRDAWAHGTYGAALVRCGEAKRALFVLERAYKNNTSESARAHNAAWIAIAESMCGNADVANQWLDTARRIDPSSYSIPLAERTLCLTAAPDA